MKTLITILLLSACAIAHAGTINTCYAARVQVTFPPGAAGQNLFMNLYSINGYGQKVHVVAFLTEGLSIGEYAVRWPGTWEVDLTMPDGEIVASQIVIPATGCWSATNAPLYAQSLADD